VDAVDAVGNDGAGAGECGYGGNQYGESAEANGVLALQTVNTITEEEKWVVFISKGGESRVFVVTGQPSACNELHVSAGVEARVILRDLRLRNDEGSPFVLSPSTDNVSGSACEVHLWLEGENRLESAVGAPAGTEHGGIPSTSPVRLYAGLQVEGKAVLVIEGGMGNLTAIGGSGGAGIGSGVTQWSSFSPTAIEPATTGNITINGGTIMAIGKHGGAGIGGGMYAPAGQLNFNGGNVFAYSPVAEAASITDISLGEVFEGASIGSGAGYVDDNDNGDLSLPSNVKNNVQITGGTIVARQIGIATAATHSHTTIIDNGAVVLTNTIADAGDFSNNNNVNTGVDLALEEMQQFFNRIVTATTGLTTVEYGTITVYDTITRQVDSFDTVIHTHYRDTTITRYNYEYHDTTLYRYNYEYRDTVIYNHKDSVVYDNIYHRDTTVYNITTLDSTINIYNYDTTYRDTVIYNRIAYRDTIIIVRKDSIVYDSIYHRDSIIYQYRDTTVYDHIYRRDTTVYTYTYQDSILYSYTVQVKDTVVYRITHRDSVIIDYTLIPETITVETIVETLIHDTLWQDRIVEVHDTARDTILIVLDEATATQHVVTDEARVSDMGEGVLIEGLTAGAPYAVYSLSGTLVARGTATPSATAVGTAYIVPLDPGTYILYHANAWSKFVHK